MTEVSRGTKKCPNPDCEFYLLYEFKGTRISVVIPGDDLNKGLNRWVEQVAVPYEELRNELNSFRKSFESGRRSSVDIPVSPFFRLNQIVDTLNVRTSLPKDRLKKVFIFLMTLEYLDSNLKQEFGAKAHSTNTKLNYDILEAVKKVASLKNTDGTPVLDIFHAADFNASYNENYGVRAVEVGASLVDNVISNSESVPDVCLPMFKKSEIEDDKFKAHLAHELTHAYIDMNTNYDRENQPVLYALDEACCNVVTEFYFPGFFSVDKNGHFTTLSVSSYRDGKNMPKSVLITGIKAFQELAKNSDSEDEVIDEIRISGVNAIQKMKKGNITPHEAILGDRRLESDFESIRSLEIAEYKMFHAFLLLDIIDSKTFNDYKKWSKDISGTTESERESKMIVDRDLKIIQKALPELEKMAEESSGELSEELERLHAKLEDLLEKEKGEKVFLKNPFCPSCGHVVKPGNYCGRCGKEVSPRSRKSLDDAIEFIVQKTSGGASFLIKRNRVRENHRKEIIDNFKLLLEYAKKENRIVMRSVEDIHREEGKISQYFQKKDFSRQYKNIEKLIEATEQIYNLSKEADKNLGEAEEQLQKAEPK